MTKMQLLQLNAIANKIENLEVTKSEEKILEIVNIIAEERKAQKLSQEALAQKANLTKNTISRIETFVSEPTLSALVQILQALNLDIIISPISNP